MPLIISVPRWLQSMEAVSAQLPWIMGAFGTVGLDVGIFLQVTERCTLLSRCCLYCSFMHD